MLHGIEGEPLPTSPLKKGEGYKSFSVLPAKGKGTRTLAPPCQREGNKSFSSLLPQGGGTTRPFSSSLTRERIEKEGLRP